MKIRILWPGKTRNRELRSLQADYLKKINRLGECEILETKEAKGIQEKYSEKIKEIEASGIEKHLKDDYIICLFEKGKEMSSEEIAQFLEKKSLSSAQPVTFVVGGFLGLAARVVNRADFLLSLSKMTFSHELTRIVLLEQIYRALSLIKGREYAK